MFRIRFYEDKRGRSQAYEYIASLKKKGSKDARIKLAKIATYLNVLQEKGTWTGEEFIILHQFVKKTQKTPPTEIEKAERELKELRDREAENEQNSK